MIELTTNLKLNGRERRIFTYKVAHDGGSAPNPFWGVCTLAICKPIIRRVALVGDIIVGLDTGINERRIVYCMEVAEVVSWRQYIEICQHALSTKSLSDVADNLGRKIPRHAKDSGDCIWPDASAYSKPLQSHSGHEGEDSFNTDVTNGRNVLLGKIFWYFGKGNEQPIELPEALKSMIPRRGHKSNANDRHRSSFISFFNKELKEKEIKQCGVHGIPAKPPDPTDETSRSRCYVAVQKNSAIGESQ